MKKRLGIIGLIVLMNLLILKEKEVFCQELEMEYVPRVLFTLNYGSASNEVSYIGEAVDAESEMGAGPSADIVVDSEENIYIGNTKFDKRGNYLFSIEEPGPFRLDKEGNIYVVKSIGLHESCIKKYDSQGRFLYTIDYDPYIEVYNANRPPEKRKIARAPSPEISKIPPFTGPPLLSDGKGTQYRVDYMTQYRLDSTVEEEEIKIEIRDSTGKTTGSFTLFSTKVKETPQRALETGTPSHKVKIPDYKDLKDGLDVEFVDGEGNIYATGLAKIEKPLVLREEYSYGYKRRLYIYSDRIIYKYDPQGNFITQIRFHKVGSGSGYFVDQSGNIYCLQFHKDGMDVVKYEWKAVSKK